MRDAVDEHFVFLILLIQVTVDPLQLRRAFGDPPLQFSIDLPAFLVHATSFRGIENGCSTSDIVPGVVIDRQGAHHHGQDGAIFANQFEVALLDRVQDRESGKALGIFLPIVWRKQVEQPFLSFNLMPLVPEPTQLGIIDRNNQALRVERVITAGRPVVQVASFLAGFLQRYRRPRAISIYSIQSGRGNHDGGDQRDDAEHHHQRCSKLGIVESVPLAAHPHETEHYRRDYRHGQ